MFDLEVPWWEFVVRATLIYAVLLLLVRLSGKRTVGQFTPFDLLVVMLLSESVSDGLSAGDKSIVGGLIAAATLIALNGVLAFASSRSGKLDAVLQGTPVLLGRDGEVYDSALRRHRVSHEDLEKALREADCELDEMASAVLEADGQISVAKKRGA